MKLKLKTLPLLSAFLVSMLLPLPAPAEDFSYTLPYRDDNRWVHVEDNQPLNDLTNYAEENSVYSFRVVLPENDKTNLYIERLLVLSRIMKARLDRESIVFRQDLGDTPKNTIKLIPIEE